MKILAFNASPRREHSSTDIVINHFPKGAEQAGATTNNYYIADLKINGCLGCFSCWAKTPGRCIHRDDMDWIIPELRAADIVVIGTPVYIGNNSRFAADYGATPNIIAAMARGAGRDDPTPLKVPEKTSEESSNGRGWVPRPPSVQHRQSPLSQFPTHSAAKQPDPTGSRTDKAGRGP